MSIEVTSVPDTSRFFLPKHILQCANSSFAFLWRSRQRLLVRILISSFAVALVFFADALLRSYKYYSQVIDARLASGYLTSRPGLYAAPRVLRRGQSYPQEKLVQALRRAGYVETVASEVWSGGFIQRAGEIEIRPNISPKKQPRIITVRFDGDRITEIVSDYEQLKSLTLEPELLSNDLS